MFDIFVNIIKFVSKEFHYSFKRALLSAVTEILPRIINVLTPLILEKSKAMIEENASRLFKIYESESNKNPKENVDDFIYENENIWYS